MDRAHGVSSLVNGEDGRACPALRRRRDANVGSAERAVCGAAGAALIAYGLRRRGLPGLAAAGIGGVLAWHGAKRHSNTYALLGIGEGDATQTSHPLNREVRSHASVTVSRPAEELYRQWRSLEGLARFFEHVESVEELEGGRSRWTAVAPGAGVVEWEAVITDEEQDRLIRWESVEGSDFEHKGEVRFTPAPGGRGTRVSLAMRYRLPAGAVGVLAARLAGSDPKQEAAGALRRFKQWVEGGEIASNDGPSGRNAAGHREITPAPPRAQRDEVQEASEESFPASDPPAYTGATATRSGDQAT